MPWIVRRFGRAILTVVVVISFSFGIIRMLPGGPMAYLKAQLMQGQGSNMDPERIRQLTQVYVNIDPEKPLLNQYIEYVLSMMSGDLGRSIWYNEPVAAILADALPWTLFIMAISILLQFGIGIALGAILAYNEGSRFDLTGTLIGMFMNSIPYYVAAVVFVYVTAYIWGWFPTGGRMTSNTTPGVNYPFIAGVFYHAALPIISLVLTGFGGWAVSMRGNSIRILGEDYLRVARLRGIPDNRIAMRYIGRNAVLPMYTQLMIAIGFLFGGSVILETIFQYPGVGWFMYKAINARDYPLMMGAFVIITIAVVIGVLFADLTYGKIDPRIATGGDDSEVF